MVHKLTKEKWMTQLWHEESKTGSGRNKLHAFRYFKSDIGVEPYVTNIVPHSVRRHFAKMRCGVAPLQIELGLYTGQAESDRLCPMCMKDVESENHVLIDCDYYFDITESLMTNASNIDPCFINMCSFDKFCFLMSHEQLQIDTAKTCQKIYLVDIVIYICVWRPQIYSIHESSVTPLVLDGSPPHYFISASRTLSFPFNQGSAF